LLAVVSIATIGGIWPALAAAVAAALLANWFFTPPIHTWTIADPVNVIALIVFICVAALVSALVTIAARRSVEAARSRSEAATLVRLAGALMAEQDPLPTIMRQLRSTFALQSVALLRQVAPDTWTVVESTG